MKSVCSILALMGALTLHSAAAVDKDLRLLIPFYAKPLYADTPVAGTPPYWTEEEAIAESKYWDDVETLGASEVGVTVVINPLNGPFQPEDTSQRTSILRPLYEQRVPPLKSAGIEEVLCYVYTQYGSRSPLEVERDIGLYAEPDYFVDPDDNSLLCEGIFFDEVSTDADKFDLYESYYNFVMDKFPGATVVLNPGSSIGSGTGQLYSIGGGAVIVTSKEDSYESLVVSQSGGKEFPPAPTASTDSNQHSVMIHTAPSGLNQTELVALMESAYCNNWGHMFLTDDPLIPNPYDQEPSFLLQLPAAMDEALGSACTAPFVLVESPEAGESYKAGKKMTTYWNFARPLGRDAVKFSVDLHECIGGDCGADGCGTFVKKLCRKNNGCAKNRYSYTKRLPKHNIANSDYYVVRVGMVGEPDLFDCSSQFTIRGAKLSTNFP
ncbi:unnamed protein product [Discosporangium mesarthrocarpum]